MRRLYAIAILGFLSITLLDACSSVPKQARYIPKDASVVVGVNTGAMSKKVAWSMITGSKLLDDLKAKSPNSKGSEAIDDISNAGIDWMNTLYFYARPDTRFDNHAKMSVIVPLDDAAKWTAFVKKTYPEANITKVKDRSEAMLGNKMYAAWTNDILMVMNTVGTEVAENISMMADTTTNIDELHPELIDKQLKTFKLDAAATIAEMDSSFNLSKDNSIADNNRFGKLQKAGHDITVFVAYDALMDNAMMRDKMGTMNLGMSASLWKDAAMSTGIDFVDGKITADMLYYPSDSMHSVAKEMGKENIDNDILGRIPNENLNMALGYHLSPEAMKMLLDKMGLSGMANLALMQKGLSVDDILGAFSGDMALSMNDFKAEKAIAPAIADTTMMVPMEANSSMPKMTLVYAIKLKDKAKLDKLLALLKTEMGVAPVSPNTYVYPMGNDSVIGLVSDKYIIVSNKMAAAQAFLQSKGNTPEMVKKEISGHPSGFMMDIKSITSNLQPRFSGVQSDSAMMAEVHNLLSSATMNGGEFKSDASNFHMELNFTNTKENSLLQLLGLAQRIADAQKKAVVVMR